MDIDYVKFSKAGVGVLSVKNLIKQVLGVLSVKNLIKQVLVLSVKS